MKTSFTHRSGQKELLDSNDIPFRDIKRNMYELNLINKYLGGHDITLKGFKQLVNRKELSNPLNVVEIGCGGG
ncbi:MAG TPA: SAM-dependent methyltransferase, partial [Chitinophagaceae bacterium]